MKKVPFVPLPQPKKVISPKVKAITRQANELKGKLGMRGKIQTGDLINKSKTMTRERLSILGLV